MQTRISLFFLACFICLASAAFAQETVTEESANVDEVNFPALPYIAEIISGG